MNSLIKVVLCTGAVSLYGCGSSSETTDTTSKSSELEQEISFAVQALYPDFKLSGSSTVCQTSSDNPLVGCYVSEQCANDDTTSRLYVTGFSSNGKISSSIFYYTSSTDCSGTSLPVGLSALDYDYEAITSVIAQSGLLVTQLDADLEFIVGNQTFTTNYFSSFFLDDGRLCFPQSDYDWNTVGGGLVFDEQDEIDRPTNINFDNCMVKINE
jgi:hypothetical protein